LNRDGLSLTSCHFSENISWKSIYIFIFFFFHLEKMMSFRRGLATLSQNDAVIVAANRTAIGSFNGKLSKLKSTDLGAAVIRDLLSRAQVNVDEVYMGNVLTAGIGQAPARQALLGGGLPESTCATTLNKVCASGLKALMLASMSIECGQREAVIAGGMESMSNVPYFVPGARNGLRLGSGAILDGILADGLTDAYSDCHMGVAGDRCAAEYGLSRQDQDEYALASYRRAQAAHEAGFFRNEIVGVEVPRRGPGGPELVDDDEEIYRIDESKIGKLRAAFAENGTVTAANASTLSDGAAALLVMSAARAAELGLAPLARIRGYADAERAPLEFTIAPADAVRAAAKRAQLDVADIEYHEINEAFSVVAMANMKLLGLDHERVNVHGGAVSIGHPIGCSGARIVVSLLNVLKQRDATIGAASICNGGGGASALIVERLS
jgi:acetyl-CoA C-acetyltransferase